MSEELVLKFNGSDYIDYVIKEKFKRDYLMKEILDENLGLNRDQQMINIKFKTKHDGVLMFIRGQRTYIMLKVGEIHLTIYTSCILYSSMKLFFPFIQIKDKKPVYIFEDALLGHLSDFSVDRPVADGVWHLLSLFSRGQNTFLSVDGKPVLNITGQSMDLTPLSVEKITLGAAPTRETVNQSGKVYS